MNAVDIMTKRVITARLDTSIGEIADLLLDHKVSPIPVIDDDRHVVGIVNEGEPLGILLRIARRRGAAAFQRSRQPAI